jgi:ketosteroid isomerase-like protein
MGAASDLAQAAWDAYFAGDIDATIASASPDVEIDLTHYEGWPEDGVYYGHAGFRRFITDWLAGWERYEAGLHELVELSPTCVFTRSWQRGHGAGSQVPVEMELAEIATFADGQMVRFELWSDCDAARADALRR